MNKRKTYTLYAFSLPVVILALVVAGTSYVNYLGTNGVKESSYVLGSKSKAVKSNKSSVTSSNKDKNVKTTVNSKKYKETITEVVNTLEEVAAEEGIIGNVETEKEVQEVAETQEEIVGEVADAIDAVESRPQWKSLLIGADYKNLGQLRSSLVHITNDMRKLNKNIDEVMVLDNQLMLREQLELMTQERARIINVLVDNRENFSILGWAFRLFNNYDEEAALNTTPVGGIDQVEETTEATEGENEIIPSSSE